jgi:hypothetical protein
MRRAMPPRFPNCFQELLVGKALEYGMQGALLDTCLEANLVSISPLARMMQQDTKNLARPWCQAKFHPVTPNRALPCPKVSLPDIWIRFPLNWTLVDTPIRGLRHHRIRPVCNSRQLEQQLREQQLFTCIVSDGTMLSWYDSTVNRA